MMRCRFWTLLLTLSTLTGGGAVRARAQFSITDLGTLGGPSSYAYGINSSGAIVGAADNAGGETHAFLYTNGAMQDLGTLGGVSCYAYCVNTGGQVVGLGDTAGGANHAFLYNKGLLMDLGSLGKGHAFAYGINTSGQIVGNSFTADSSVRAFRTSPGAVLKTTDALGTLGGATSEARGINDAGMVIGNSQTGAGEFHAFRTAPNKPITAATDDLGTLGGKSSYAYGVNGGGAVVGAAETGKGEMHAFLYSGGKRLDLGTLGGSSSYAYGINSSGAIVGAADTAAGETHAFLFSGGTMLDLNALLPANSGWTLLSATALNESQWIVGYGRKGGVLHAFLLKAARDVTGVLTLDIDCANPAQPMTFEFRPVGSPLRFTRSLTLDSNGAYRLTGLPAGRYDLAIKGAKWLRKVVPVDTTTKNASQVNATLAAGDIFEDNSVDILDYSELALAFDTAVGDPDYNELADLNCDGSVDILDYSLLALNFDTEGDD